MSLNHTRGYMSKLELEMPQNYFFETELEVRFADVRNAAVHGTNVSHMVFDMYLSYVNEAFDLFLEKYGFSKFDIAGVNLIIPNCQANYLGELNPHDKVKIEVCPTNFEDKACDIFFKMTKNNSPVASVKLGIIFFDYSIHKPVKVPQKFLELFKR
jgi:acyl-CoA thioesterase FadM